MLQVSQKLLWSLTNGIQYINDEGWKITGIYTLQMCLFGHTTTRVEKATGHLIFLTRKWKSSAVRNFELLKMSGRVINFYLSRSCQLKKVDVIICSVHYSSRFNFLSFSLSPYLDRE